MWPFRKKKKNQKIETVEKEDKIDSTEFWFKLNIDPNPESFSKMFSKLTKKELEKYFCSTDEFIRMIVKLSTEFSLICDFSPYEFSYFSMKFIQFIKNQSYCPLSYVLFKLTFQVDDCISIQNSCLENFEILISLTESLALELNQDYLPDVVTSKASSEMKELFSRHIRLLKKIELDSLNKKALSFIQYLAFERFDFELLKLLTLSDQTVQIYFRTFKSKECWLERETLFLIDFISLFPSHFFKEINCFSFGNHPMTPSIFSYWMQQLKCSFDEDFILKLYLHVSKHPKKEIHLDENFLFYVCRIGDFDLYSLVASTCPSFINEKNSNGFTPLNIANSRGLYSFCKKANEKFDAKMNSPSIQVLSNDVLVHVFSFLVDFDQKYDSKSLLNLKLTNAFFYQAVLSEELWAMICSKKRNILTLTRESWMVTAFSLYADDKLSNSKYFKLIRSSMTNGDRSWRKLSTIPEIYSDISNRKVDFEDLYLKKKIPEKIYFDFKFSNANRPIDMKLMANSIWKELKRKYFTFDDRICECFFPNLELRRLIFQTLTMTSGDMVHNSFPENVPVYSKELNVESDYFIRFFIGKRDLDFQLIIVSDEVFILAQGNEKKRIEFQEIYDIVD
jgi:hypothetical protein